MVSFMDLFAGRYGDELRAKRGGYEGLPRLQPRLAEVGEGKYLVPYEQAII